MSTKVQKEERSFPIVAALSRADGTTPLILLSIAQANSPVISPCWTFSAFTFLCFFFLRLFVCLFDREREREHKQRQQRKREKQTSHRAGSPTGTRSQDPGVMTWAEGRPFTNWGTQVYLTSLCCWTRPCPTPSTDPQSTAGDTPTPPSFSWSISLSWRLPLGFHHSCTDLQQSTHCSTTITLVSIQTSWKKKKTIIVFDLHFQALIWQRIHVQKCLLHEGTNEPLNRGRKAQGGRARDQRQKASLFWGQLGVGGTVDQAINSWSQLRSWSPGSWGQASCKVAHWVWSLHKNQQNKTKHPTSLFLHSSHQQI